MLILAMLCFSALVLCSGVPPITACRAGYAPQKFENILGTSSATKSTYIYTQQILLRQEHKKCCL